MSGSLPRRGVPRLGPAGIVGCPGGRPPAPQPRLLRTRQTRGVSGIPQVGVLQPIGIGDWGLGIKDGGLGIGDWGLGIGD